jgi:hypothetical protein
MLYDERTTIYCKYDVMGEAVAAYFKVKYQHSSLRLQKMKKTQNNLWSDRGSNYLHNEFWSDHRYEPALSRCIKAYAE